MNQHRIIKIFTLIMQSISISFLMLSDISLYVANNYDSSNCSLSILTKLWLKTMKVIGLSLDTSPMRNIWIIVSIILSGLSILIGFKVKDLYNDILILIISIFILILFITIYFPLAQFIAPMK